MIDWTKEAPKLKHSFAAVIDTGFVYQLAAAWEHVQEEEQIMDMFRNYMKHQIFDKIPNWNGLGIYCMDSNVSYRKQMNKDYKANRKSAKPRWLKTMLNKLRPKGFEIKGFEADDVACIYQTLHEAMFLGKDRENDKIDYRTMLVSADKDLVQSAGYFYKPPRNHNGKQYGDEYAYVTPSLAERHMWFQVLKGDSVDGIKGLEQVGEKFAEELMSMVDRQNAIAKRAKYETDFSYRDMVYTHYTRKYGVRQGEKLFDLNLNMIKLVTFNDSRDFIQDMLKGIELPDLFTLIKKA